MTIEHDYIEASSEHLVNLLKSLDPTALKDALIAQIKAKGSTKNQRTLLTDAAEQVVKQMATEAWPACTCSGNNPRPTSIHDCPAKVHKA